MGVDAQVDLRVVVAGERLHLWNRPTLTEAMSELLDALRTWPDIELARLRDTPEWSDALEWGRIMGSGELTGSGWRHVHELPGGLVSDWRT